MLLLQHGLVERLDMVGRATGPLAAPRRGVQLAQLVIAVGKVFTHCLGLARVLRFPVVQQLVVVAAASLAGTSRLSRHVLLISHELRVAAGPVPLILLTPLARRDDEAGWLAGQRCAAVTKVAADIAIVPVHVLD